MSTQSEFSATRNAKLDDTPIDEKLIPPFVDDIGPDEGLPIKLVYGGYHYRVHPYPGMAVGQVVRPIVEYKGQGSWHGAKSEITDDNLGAELAFKQQAFTAPYPGQKVEFYYLLKQKDGSTSRSSARVYTIVA
jgi:hypothetical protein